MLSEDFSSETDNEEHWNTDFASQNLALNGDFGPTHQDIQNGCQVVSLHKILQSSKSFMLQNLCYNPKYNKKLSIFLNKIHSKRIPELFGVFNTGFPAEILGVESRKRFSASPDQKIFDFQEGRCKIEGLKCPPIEP